LLLEWEDNDMQLHVLGINLLSIKLVKPDGNIAGIDSLSLVLRRLFVYP
jgi:hypothetical protein